MRRETSLDGDDRATSDEHEHLTGMQIGYKIRITKISYMYAYAYALILIT
jgi:hypothetical protein